MRVIGRRWRSVTAQLPPDTLALAADASEVACWWRERTSAEDAVESVDRLHEITAESSAEIQMVADAAATSDETAEGMANEAPRTRR